MASPPIAINLDRKAGQSVRLSFHLWQPTHMLQLGAQSCCYYFDADYIQISSIPCNPALAAFLFLSKAWV